MNKLFNTVDEQFAPDFDMCVWGWYNALDPGQSLGGFCTDQINKWSDSAYSNPEYDELFVEQSHTIDAAKRKAIIDRMQQIIFDQSPYLVLVYNDDVEGWNTAKWTGWVHSPAGFGNAVNQTGVIATYLNVKPKVEAAETGGGSGLGAWTAVIAAVFVMGAVIIVLLRRRSSRAVEE